MQKKKILFITSRLPYPPIGGDKLKSYWLLKTLSKHFKIHLVSIADENVPDNFNKWVQEIGITVKIFRKSKIYLYINTLKSLFNNLPLQVNYYYFKDVQNYIDKIYNDFDLLFAVLIRTARYIINKNKPKILEMTDSISLNYLNSRSKTHSIFWKFIHNLETDRLINFEKLCIEKFDKTLLVNKEEAKFYNRPDKVIWLPNGVDERLLDYHKLDEVWKNSIVFFGKMNYQPNIDAVIWFIKNVLPYLDKRLQFVIVGAYPPKSIKRFERKYKNVKVLGFVEDPYIILKSCLCVVAPMQTGGGIQNKILESMALGTINIVSSRAAKPFGEEGKKCLLIIDNPKEMAELINSIYKNPKKYESLKEKSKSYIKEHFTWSIYEKKILQVIDNVI